MSLQPTSSVSSEAQGSGTIKDIPESPNNDRNSTDRTRNSSSTNCNCQYVWRDIIWPLVPSIVGTGLAIGSCIAGFSAAPNCSDSDRVAAIALGVSALCLAIISCIRLSCFPDKDRDDTDEAFYNANPGMKRPAPIPPTYNFRTGRYEYGGTPTCKPVILVTWFFMVPAVMAGIIGIVMGAIPLPKYSCS